VLEEDLAIPVHIPLRLMFELSSLAVVCSGCNGDGAAAATAAIGASDTETTGRLFSESLNRTSSVALAGLAHPMVAAVPAMFAASAVANVSCPRRTASESGSQVTSEVRLVTQTVWPPIDNINMIGGRAISAKGRVEGSTVGPVNIRGAYSAFYTDDSSNLRNIFISNINVTNAQREGIRLRGQVEGVTICNFAIRMRAESQSGTHLPEGISVYNGKNIVIQDGFISGFRMVPVEGEYTNGDGISSERPVVGLAISRVTANDNSDAGFDLKSDQTYLYDTVAERNFRNYRFWTRATTGTIRSVDPVQAHIWVGAGAEVVIDRLIAKSSNTGYVLWLDPDAKSVTIRSCDLDLPPGTRFYKRGSNARLILGLGCSDR
jgi:hypothetical protein